MTERNHDLAVEKKDDERSYVGSQVDDFGLRVGGLDAELCKYGKSNDQEGTCSRPVEAVISADEEGGEGQDDYKDVRHDAFRHEQRDVATAKS